MQSVLPVAHQPSEADGERPERDVFANLLAEHEPYLRSFVSVSLSPAARLSVSDIVQSIIRQALACPGSFRYRSEGEFRAWLRTAARNKIRNKIRGRDPEAAPDPDDLPERSDGGPGPGEHALRREELERLQAALDELPEDDADLVRMHRILGMSLAEIARLRAQPSSTLGSRFQRSMTVLASRMRPLA